MDIKQTDLYWFQLNEEIRVEDVDKFSGNNMHPDRMMTQWVLVLMISGERSFRVYGENYVVHSGEFFLLPPYVQHCGLQYDNHAAYFAHFQATGIPDSTACKGRYQSYFASVTWTDSSGAALL